VDDSYKDAFGSSSFEVAGRELSSLSPDQEALEGFLKACSQLKDADVADGAYMLLPYALLPGARRACQFFAATQIHWQLQNLAVRFS
jgi:hypothetical protein